MTYIVGILGSLVDGNARRAAHSIRLRSQSAAEFEGVGTVETSRTVIPALQRRITQSSLSDGDTLTLTTRHATNEVVTNTGVLRMRDTKHGHRNITKMLGIFASGNALGDVLGASGASCEVQGVSDRQVGEMLVNLGGVNGLTPEGGAHVLGLDALVVDSRVVTNVESVRVTGDRLQQGRAAGTGRTEDSKHLAAVNDTLEVVEDIDPLLFGSSEFLDQARRLKEDVADALLVVGGCAIAKDIEILEGNACCLWRISFRSIGADVVEGLGPLSCVEVWTAGVQGAFGGDWEERTGGGVGLRRVSASELQNLVVHSRFLIRRIFMLRPFFLGGCAS